MERLKKTLMLFMALFLFTGSLYAVNYQFWFNFNATPELGMVKNDPVPVRSSFSMTSDIGFLSMRLDRKNTISVPISVSWTTRSSTRSYFPLHSHFDLTASLAYQYNADPLFSLRMMAGGGIRIYEKIKGWTPIYFTGGLDFYISPTNHFAINFPLRMIVIDNEIDVRAGIGVTVYYDVFTSKEERNEIILNAPVEEKTGITTKTPELIFQKDEGTGNSPIPDNGGRA